MLHLIIWVACSSFNGCPVVDTTIKVEAKAGECRVWNSGYKTKSYVVGVTFPDGGNPNWAVTAAKDKVDNVVIRVCNFTKPGA